VKFQNTLNASETANSGTPPEKTFAIRGRKLTADMPLSRRNSTHSTVWNNRRFFNLAQSRKKSASLAPQIKSLRSALRCAKEGAPALSGRG
jgi:hypothetical protein